MQELVQGNEEWYKTGDNGDIIITDNAYNITAKDGGKHNGKYDATRNAQEASIMKGILQERGFGINKREMNYFVLDLVEEIKDLMEELLLEKHSLDNFGSLLAYMEVLTIIHDELPEEERAAYGLDFDVDRYYFKRIDERDKKLGRDD
ncbi:hypothetical protein [Christensenella intestinihominis]|uniref:hypothetical protein n=1 Tax=Christensenella intestinihominis TaxID=1851429 RepID=UPI0011CB1534|nr:hypothetical protein [Christensenella intestinihominis]